jgi:hypothetical protein
MALNFPTDSAGNLLVTINGTFDTTAAGMQGNTSVGSSPTGRPVQVGINADGANGAAATVQRAAGDAALAQAVNTEGRLATYFSAFQTTPPGAATDTAMLIGSATKVVKLRRVTITGIATGAITIDVIGIKRSVADTVGGITAQTAVNADTNDVAATAVASLFTSNPTLGATGSKYGQVMQDKLVLGVAAGTTTPGVLVWEFGRNNDKPMFLRGIADAFCVNLNGVQADAGQRMNIKFEWSEE